MSHDQRASTLNLIKYRISQVRRGDVIYFILIGSYLDESYPEDIDIAIVIHDEANSYELIRDISPALAELTREIGTLVTCFPIKVKDYINRSSQFIENIYENGFKF